MEKKPIDDILPEGAQKSIKMIEKLLKDMHKTIKELMDLENLEKGAKVIEEKSIRISKIAIVLQNCLDHENGGQVARNLDHLYKHIRYAVSRVIDKHDFSFLTSAEKVTAEINQGWQQISASAA